MQDVENRSVRLPLGWIGLHTGKAGVEKRRLPSGKPTKNDGTSPFFMGKSTIFMVIFNSYVKLPEGKEIAV